MLTNQQHCTLSWSYHSYYCIISSMFRQNYSRSKL